MPGEIAIKVCWREIPGYDGTYIISDLGSVINVKRGRVRKTHITVSGYESIMLSKKGKSKSFLLHRLIGQAFIANPKKLPCVNHKDENKKNNHYKNLEWCDHGYNTNYGTRNARVSAAMLNGKLSKPLEQLKRGSVVDSFLSTRDAGRHGYNQVCVARCCRTGGTYLGYNWRYTNE